MKYLTQRLQEPSTWSGIGAAGAAGAAGFAAGGWGGLLAGLVPGLLGIFMPEKTGA